MCLKCLDHVAWISFGFFSFIIIFIFKILQDKQMIKTINDCGFWFLNDECFFPFLKSTTLLLQCQLILQCPLQWNLKRWRIKHCRQHFLKMKCTFFIHTYRVFPLGQNDGASCRVGAVLDGDARTLHATLSFTTVHPYANYFLFILLTLLVWVWVRSLFPDV